MAHYEHGADYTGATYDDTLTNGYGETVRIIGETPRGTAWVTLSERGNRRILTKDTHNRLTITEQRAN